MEVGISPNEFRGNPFLMPYNLPIFAARKDKTDC